MADDGELFQAPETIVQSYTNNRRCSRQFILPLNLSADIATSLQDSHLPCNYLSLVDLPRHLRRPHGTSSRGAQI
jgi:hypothetical protein